ncbi:DEAD/DEAH box helicase [Sinorhizobium meliloti]|uniref:DEAD/DEAH box helicase n=1 Tax=Rhizobium meliloti TaxID=382 RepID=UPI000FD80DE8|nr:DEAD/DEAH box helicase family protein [Sinorhizobium meliloti]RVO48174.1 DEAD/DEAH box helicase [Sinorhizobium meliloti]
MVRNPKDLQLWAHQLAAAAKCDAYFASGSERGCLVHMPTGTGKTGVMAVLAAQRAQTSPVLVVCPSAALVEQLKGEFESEFWDRITAAQEWRPDIVLQALPGSIDNLANRLAQAEGQRIIIVATIQAVQQIYAADAIDRLTAHVGTILFDEGHREPAPIWATVVRGFAVPTVLFSATPFRGDMKVFDIDDDHIYFLSFSGAVNQALIRGVTIDERNLSSDPLEFAQEIVAERDRLVTNGTFPATCKVIVRAANEATVTQLFAAFSQALNGRDDGVLAMHNTFKESGEAGAQRRGNVPRLRPRPEKFLIHQFMLVEGIDDPACTMLALYEPFNSTRMLVQQIGRLTRQPPGQIAVKVSDAIVLARSGEGVREQWGSFLTYDKACQDNGGKPPMRNSEQVLRNLVDALPKMDFIDGQFRERLDFEDDDGLAKDLLFPKAAVVYEFSSEFDMDDFQADVSALLEQEDRFQQLVGTAAGGSCRFHVSLGLAQSPFLAETLFQSVSLDVTIYACAGSRLFFYDSAGLWVDEIDNIGARLSPKTLRSLMPKEAEDAISFLAVKNTDLGPMALRSRTLAAKSLNLSGTFMGEHMNVVTRATGVVDKTRRSVGFSRARVRDGSGYTVTAQEFAEWCDTVNEHINLARPAAPLFDRFATAASAPGDKTPINILIDVQELTERFMLEGRRVDVDPEGMCVDVIEEATPKAPGPFKFELTIGGVAHTIWLKWDSRKKKYWLVSNSLSQIKVAGDSKVSLTRRLNQSQAFRIITADHRHVYVHGAFYAIDLDLADPQGPCRLVLDLITPIVELAGITSEKGVPGGEKLETWRAGSLFRFVDEQVVEGRGDSAFGVTFPAVVCDDLGTEAGDFIGVDERSGSQRVAFMVCKRKPTDAKEVGVSTSAFYDVSGQGLKNLAYLKSDGADVPGEAKKFDKDWKMSKDHLTDKVPRKRAGPASVAFRNMLARVKRSPGAERSIWLVCAGGMLSKEALEKEFKAPRPKPHVLQFYHLVVSAFSACQSVGVQLKIFCAK